MRNLVLGFILCYVLSTFSRFCYLNSDGANLKNQELASKFEEYMSGRYIAIPLAGNCDPEHKVVWNCDKIQSFLGKLIK